MATATKHNFSNVKIEGKIPIVNNYTKLTTNIMRNVLAEGYITFRIVQMLCLSVGSYVMMKYISRVMAFGVIFHWNSSS